MDGRYVVDQITELRMKACISEYQLSLDLGKSKSYIQNITSAKALPSLKGLMDICEYFDITLAEFFDPEIHMIVSIEKVINAIENIDMNNLEKAFQLIEDLKR